MREMGFAKIFTIERKLSSGPHEKKPSLWHKNSVFQSQTLPSRRPDNVNILVEEHQQKPDLALKSDEPLTLPLPCTTMKEVLGPPASAKLAPIPLDGKAPNYVQSHVVIGTQKTDPAARPIRTKSVLRRSMTAPVTLDQINQAQWETTQQPVVKVREGRRPVRHIDTEAVRAMLMDTDTVSWSQLGAMESNSTPETRTIHQSDTEREIESDTESNSDESSAFPRGKVTLHRSNAELWRRSTIYVLPQRKIPTRVSELEINTASDKGDPEIGAAELPFRVGFCIPHRFHVDQSFIRNANPMLRRICGLCKEKIAFRHKSAVCRDCRMVCHSTCQAMVPPTCGMPKTYPQVSIFGTVQGSLVGANVFEVPLKTLATREQLLVPHMINAVVRRVEEEGLDTEGLYRVCGPHTEIEAMRMRFNFGRPNLANTDVHVCTSLLKKLLRETPEPLLTHELQPRFIEALELQNRWQRHKALRRLVASLPEAHQATLQFIMQHLYRVVEHSSTNKMTARNLATIFGPTIFRDQMHDLTVSGYYIRVVEELLALDKSFWGSV
eukprot:comp5082_c0_seq1/m.1171 comp5082_c0_seq1/g.1171  ORF comp5082_c0_seq1/g.1171 comp5082_c0_seq1/m.1171 type:complete len:552 (-) comp5082_c0_seq1:33-1688(-)